MDVLSFPWWSQTNNVAPGEKPLVTLKTFKHGCLRNLTNTITASFVHLLQPCVVVGGGVL